MKLSVFTELLRKEVSSELIFMEPNRKWNFDYDEIYRTVFAPTSVGLVLTKAPRTTARTIVPNATLLLVSNPDFSTTITTRNYHIL